MKVLIVSQYFWPENFKINDVARGLHERGFEVSVLTGVPNYPSGIFYKGYSFISKTKENWNGITIYRSPVIPRGKGTNLGLFLNYLSLALFASIRILFSKKKFDRIFVYEASPITIGIPAIIAKYRFNAPIVFWVQDLWPASITAAGGVTNKNVLYLVNNLTKFIYYHSKIILVQSKAFVEYIVNQNVDINKIKYLPNSTENFYKKTDKENKYKKLMPKGPILMFAGNIGEAQSFDTIIKSAHFLKKTGKNINWIILGDGRQKEFMQRKVIELELQSSFSFLGSYSSEEMPEFFSHADALLVTLKKSLIFSMTIPNKIQSYMACSKPIIASLDGEGGRVILEAKSGYVSPAEDHIALSKSIIKFFSLSVADQELMGLNARKYFEKEFEREKQLDNITNIFHSI